MQWSVLIRTLFFHYLTAPAMQNSNAYLLFYRRRTTQPLGGKTYVKIEEARLNLKASPSPDPIVIDTQLPTPPSEKNASYFGTELTTGLVNLELPKGPLRPTGSDGWPTPRSNVSNSGSPASSPPALEDGLPSFEDAPYDELLQTNLDPLQIASQQFDFPDPSNKGSPTSSNEAEPDLDEPFDDDTPWNDQHFDLPDPLLQRSPDWAGLRRMESPTGSNNSDMNPFSDANAQNTKHDDTDSRDKHTLDVDL